MKLTIYNPTQREPKCSTCEYGVIHRNSLRDIDFIQCRHLDKEITNHVSECSAYATKDQREIDYKLFNNAAILRHSPSTDVFTWTFDERIIRSKGKWRKPKVAKRRLVSVTARKRRNPGTPTPEPEKVN